LIGVPQVVDIANIAIEGLLVGGIYALAALGIALIFSVMRILNLAHGNFIMLGAVVTFSVFNLLPGGSPGLLGLALTLPVVLVVFAALGGGFEYFLIKPILRPSRDVLISGILITIGLALVLQDYGRYVAIRAPGNISRTSTLSLNVPSIASTFLGGYYFASSKLISLAVIVTAGAALYLFFKRTYLGMAMRSISQDREAAVVVGVSLRKISVITFALGTLFAGFAGFILVIDQTADPVLGLGYTIKLLTIMILGGVRSPLGPVIGGLLLGVIEFTVAAIFGAYWISAVSLLILISILVVRPTGLTGGQIG
jgi:branched-chain amino acid transport system permease protein